MNAQTLYMPVNTRLKMCGEQLLSELAHPCIKATFLTHNIPVS